MARADQQSRRGESKKAQKWAARIEAWQRSGKTQAEFCRRRNLGYSQFQWWRRRLARTTVQAVLGQTPAHTRKMDAFIPVRVTPSDEIEAIHWACEVQARGGLTVRLREQPQSAEVCEWLGLTNKEGASCG